MHTLSMRLKMGLVWVLAFIIPIAASGCATVPKRNPVPKDLVDRAMVGDMESVRTFVGSPNPAFQKDLIAALQYDDTATFPADAAGVRTYPILVVSGGGANGAYGAGLLKGWSQSGTRPEFKVVTGVSTGALTAPFAFLGKEFDGELERYYTTTGTKDVMIKRPPMDAMFGDCLASNAPLAKKIAEIITPGFLQKIAAKHKEGRRLFVGTIYLDAQRFTVWNMGEIAVRGDAELFRKVILASAAIPVVFPPTHFSVKAEGKTYEEMHVDGGTMTQMFSLFKLTQGLDDAVRRQGTEPTKIKARYYFIRNGYVSGTYKKVENQLSDIANRSFEMMVDALGVGDTYRIYEFMKLRGNDYNLAYIPSDFRPEAKEMFDPAQMRSLFDKGYQEAVAGYSWHKAPPGVEQFEEINQ